MNEGLRLLGLAALLSMPGAGHAEGSDTYTLYRNSVLNEKMRLHVATFDSVDGSDYNRENCQLAQQLFQRQFGVKTRFWCENGRFQK